MLSLSYNLLDTIGTVKEDVDLIECPPTSVALTLQMGDKVAGQIIFRAVFRMRFGQPKHHGEGKGQIAKHGQNQHRIIAHHISLVGMVKQFMDKVHILTGFLRLGVVNNERRAVTALIAGITPTKLIEFLEKRGSASSCMSRSKAWEYRMSRPYNLRNSLPFARLNSLSQSSS